MASKGGNRSDGEKTKVRFMYFEAEGDAADLQQFAQAIANVARPTIVQVTAPAPPVSLPRPAQQKSAEVNENTLPFMQEEEVVELSEVQPAPKRPSSSGAKKKLAPPTPSVLDELNLTDGPVPFAKYFQEKNPTEHTKRYLVVAAWLKEYRQINEINSDHIYTCYKLLHMNVVKDVGGVFRHCKRQGWVSPGSQRGYYAINHIGLNEVNDMSNGD